VRESESVVTGDDGAGTIRVGSSVERRKVRHRVPYSPLHHAGSLLALQKDDKITDSTHYYSSSQTTHDFVSFSLSLVRVCSHSNTSCKPIRRIRLCSVAAGDVEAERKVDLGKAHDEAAASPADYARWRVAGCEAARVVRVSDQPWLGVISSPTNYASVCEQDM
jgi:hypothetical protein